MSRKLNEYVYPYRKIKIGSLVEVRIIKRKLDLAVIVDRNVGMHQKDYWYVVHSIFEDRQYAAYPNELKILSGETED